MASKSQRRATQTHRRRATARGFVRVEVKNAFDIFGSELPDEAFSGVFDQPRQRDGLTLVTRNIADIASAGVSFLDPFSA